MSYQLISRGNAGLVANWFYRVHLPASFPKVLPFGCWKPARSAAENTDIKRILDLGGGRCWRPQANHGYPPSIPVEIRDTYAVNTELENAGDGRDVNLLIGGLMKELLQRVKLVLVPPRICWFASRERREPGHPLYLLVMGLLSRKLAGRIPQAELSFRDLPASPRWRRALILGFLQRPALAIANL